MAKLLTQNQHTITGVRNPASVYSRIIGALAIVKTPDVRAFGYTSSLGNYVWLKKVSVWFMPNYAGDDRWVDFWVRFGTGRPPTFAAMGNWEDILPIHWLGAGPLGYREHGTGLVFEWTMNRLFQGEGIRFGIQLEVEGTINYEEMYASFEISEG